MAYLSAYTLPNFRPVKKHFLLLYIVRLSIKSQKGMSEKISEITGSIFFSTKLIRNSFPEYLPVSTKVWKEPAVTFTNLSPSRGSKKQTRGPCVSLLTWETISYNKYAWARLYLYSTHMVKQIIIQNGPSVPILFYIGQVVLKKKNQNLSVYFHNYNPL